MKFVCSIRLVCDDLGSPYVVLSDGDGYELRNSLHEEWQNVDIWRIWYALLHDCVI